MTQGSSIPPLIRRLKGDSYSTPTYTTDDAFPRLSLKVDDIEGELLEIKPYTDNDGIKDGVNLLQSLHDVQIDQGENISGAHSFEVWYNRGEFRFLLYANNRRAAERFKRRVSNIYENAEVNPVQTGDAFPTILPEFERSAAYLDEQRHTFLPIKHHDAEGFEIGDPYSDILGAMTTLDNSFTVLQVIFKPAAQDWTAHGPENGEAVEDIADNLRSSDVESLLNPSAWFPGHELEEREPTEKDKEAAKIVENQRGRQGFHTNIRVLACSPSEEEAVERARGIAGMFSKYFNTKTEQGLQDHAVAQASLSDQYEAMLRRKWVDRKMVLSIDELAGVAHIPNQEIGVPGIPWRHSQTGSNAPSQVDKDESDDTFTGQMSTADSAGAGQAGDASALGETAESTLTDDSGRPESQGPDPSQMDGSTINPVSRLYPPGADRFQAKPPVYREAAETIAENIVATFDIDEIERRDLDNAIHDRVEQDIGTENEATAAIAAVSNLVFDKLDMLDQHGHTRTYQWVESSDPSTESSVDQKQRDNDQLWGGDNVPEPSTADEPAGTSQERSTEHPAVTQDPPLDPTELPQPNECSYCGCEEFAFNDPLEDWECQGCGGTVDPKSVEDDDPHESAIDQTNSTVAPSSPSPPVTTEQETRPAVANQTNQHSQSEPSGIERIADQHKNIEQIQDKFEYALLLSIPPQIREERLNSDSTVEDLIQIVDELEGTGKLRPFPDPENLEPPTGDVEYDFTQTGTEQHGQDVPVENTPGAERPADVIEVDPDDESPATEADPAETTEYEPSEEELTEASTPGEPPDSQPSDHGNSGSSTEDTSSDGSVSESPGEGVTVDTTDSEQQLVCMGCSETKFDYDNQWVCENCGKIPPEMIQTQLTEIAHTLGIDPSDADQYPTPVDTAMSESENESQHDQSNETKEVNIG